MEENTIDMFQLDEDGQIIYEGSSENTELSDDLFASEVESEVEENGNHVDSNVDSGAVLTDEMENEEIFEETQNSLVVSLGDDAVPVVLSDEVTVALLDASTPAGGTLASTTLDYFDRIVSGLPSDAVYVAYRTDSDSSYDGVLYYSDDFVVSDNTVTFGEGSRQVHVERVTSSGYSATTNYTEYDATDVVVNLSKSGDVVYYSNAEVGYPLLGGLQKPFSLSPFLVVGLMSAMAVVVLQKLILKR